MRRRRSFKRPTARRRVKRRSFKTKKRLYPLRIGNRF